MTEPGGSHLGVVVKTTQVRESDLIVTLYTESLGRVSALARGARRSQRRFAGTLSLLVLGRYQLGRRTRGGELYTLEGGEVVREWTELARDVVGVAHASYAIELVGAVVPAEVPEPAALELLVALWDCLAAHGPSPAALRLVELTLLELAGQRPAIEACAVCGEADLASGAVFDPARGGALCKRCAATSRGAGVRPLDPAARAYLCAVGEAASPSEARALDDDARFAPADRHAARDAMLASVQVFVGHPLKSLEYIAKLGRPRSMLER